MRELEQSGNTLVWIMREDRRENGKAKERFGDFYAEKDCSYVGFYRNEEFTVIRILPTKRKKVDVSEEYDQLSALIEQYGYRTETTEYPEQVVIREDKT